MFTAALLTAAMHYSGPTEFTVAKERVSHVSVWNRLAKCESGGRRRAVSRNHLYFGLYQFSLGTWHSLGYHGNPINASTYVQTRAAQKLQHRSGWHQWPVCSRKIGVR